MRASGVVGDTMPTEQDIENQQDLLATYRRTLAHYLKQRAIHGLAHVPPSVVHGIVETRVEINQIKAVLTQWGAEVEDHPDDHDYAIDPNPYLEAVFSQATQALLKGDLWEAKRLYERVLSVDPFYPKCKERIQHIEKTLSSMEEIAYKRLRTYAGGAPFYDAADEAIESWLQSFQSAWMTENVLNAATKRKRRFILILSNKRIKKVWRKL